MFHIKMFTKQLIYQIKKSSGHLRRARIPQNIERMYNSLQISPGHLLEKHTQSFGISCEPTCRVFHRVLHYYCFKLVVTRLLRSIDYYIRKSFTQ